MSKELELKYRIKEPALGTINEFLTIDKISNFNLSDIEKKDIVDVYYDTQDYKISKSNSVLRLRVENFNSFFITIKTSLPRKDSESAAFERDEYEDSLTEEVVTEVYHKLKKFGLEIPDFERNDFLNYGLYGMFKIWDLKEIFVCENTRKIRNLFENKNIVAELCIDDVLVSTFGKKEKFQEMEIEAKNGNFDKIEQISDFLKVNYSEKLDTGKQSKYETGIRLLLGKNIVEY